MANLAKQLREAYQQCWKSEDCSLDIKDTVPIAAQLKGTFSWIFSETIFSFNTVAKSDPTLYEVKRWL